MALTRREMLTTSLGAAAGVTAMGAGAAVPAVLNGIARPATRAAQSMVAYVKAGTNELHVMVGDRQVVVRDAELVRRLVAAVH